MANRLADSAAAGEWLVVYGSLMRELPDASGGKAPDLLDRLEVGPGLRRVGPCRIAGSLFDLGPPPALRRGPDHAGTVCGELHALLDPAVLAVLDAYEGYDPRDPEGSDYLRECVELLEPTGVSGWIYVYNRALEADRRIASGDWRSHLAERHGSPHVPGSSLAADRVGDVRAPQNRWRRPRGRTG